MKLQKSTISVGPSPRVGAGLVAMVLRRSIDQIGMASA